MPPSWDYSELDLVSGNHFYNFNMSWISGQQFGKGILV